ncbi:hypothetical protein Zm00014a_038267 [Zea mays]|uniref:F-box domain-containing protein n=1 Tax=Zea mays TaxID=4577 RepID=A0A3L6DW54_MAIZE|nr:hypothetical protein Zm00014a_038267 [Zea mays]
MAPPPPYLTPHLVGEILVRIPPDDPATLVRASLVCKPWRRLLCDRAFRRRYGAFHRAPPLLGYIHNHSTSGPRFVSTATPSSLLLKAFGGCSNNGWRVIDCRHGRVLFEAVDPYCNWRNILCWVPDVSPSLAVWDSGTCEKKKLLPEAPFPGRQFFNAAVLYAARGCDHLDCRGGPFVVALVGYNDVAGALQSQSHLYSSESGYWWSSSSAPPGPRFSPARTPSVVIGDVMYLILSATRRPNLQF